MIRIKESTRILMATIVAALALISAPTAPPAQAAGLVNCADVIGSPVGCYELVWADGVQLRMTFANQRFAGSTPGERVGNFYVMAPQTGAIQGTAPFLHDHVVGSVPRQNHGSYTVHLHAYFVFCSAEGIASGGCVPTMTYIEGMGTVPLATTVNGQMLTSVGPIELAANSELITLIDTGGYLVATINPGR